MAGTGGARPGAGRKPKRDKHATAIGRAERQIRDRLPELIDNLFELAEGIEVQERDANGGVKVYSRPPDRQANEYLLNRIMGKPTEHKELTGKAGGPLQLVDVTKMTDAELRAIVEAEGDGGA